jgi:hypothetical protein
MVLGDNYNFAKYLESKEKYPPALKYYREVLKADPKHPEARKWVDIIESIYKKRGKNPPSG